METAYLTVALALIGGGLLLLIAELFLPTGGILAAISVALIVIGITVPFFYGDPASGLLTLLGVCVVVPIVVSVMMNLAPRTPLVRRMIREGPVADDDTVASMPVIVELEQLRGRLGRAVSPLRPSGVVDFDGRRIDTLTEGMMVEPGTWVRCIDVKAGRVLVRPVDKPDLGDLENANFE